MQDNTENTRKKAIVFAGGGSKGAYQAGAWKALEELGEHFDIATGTSIGSLFMSGIIPGILIGIFIYYAMKISSRGRQLVQMPKAGGKERWAAFKNAVWGLLMLGWDMWNQRLRKN